MLTILFILLQLPIFSSLSADFVQQRTSSYLATAEVSKGHFEYKAPNYLRWEYKMPKALVWEVGGETEDKNRNVTRLMNVILQTIDGKNLRSNDMFDVQQNDNVYILRPKRRDMQRFFTSITVTLNGKTRVADMVVITEANGDVTSLTFSGVVAR